MLYDTEYYTITKKHTQFIQKADVLYDTEYYTITNRHTQKTKQQQLIHAYICKRLMEVAGWKQGTTNEPQPEVPDFISSFLFDGTCERLLELPLTFSRAVSVTSK